MNKSFEKSLDQLKLCEITGGTFIDAGCGSGTYTFPLSTLVNKVIAIDKSPSNIERLKKKKNKYKNIEFLIMDFSSEIFYESQVNGILFAFSLHFVKEALIPIRNARKLLKNPGGCIIIFEYTRSTPVPWIPYPIPQIKMHQLLKTLVYDKYVIIHSDNRYYIVKIIF